MDMKCEDGSNGEHEDRILVFGVGGCGVNIVRWMDAGWGDKLRAYAVDTDPQSFHALQHLERIHLETSSTQGKSTAGDVDIGRQAVLENRERLTTLCTLADMVFIVAGFGGGTGTGGAEALAEIASDAGALILSFITIPFGFEGLERQKTALKGLRNMQDLSDGVVVIHNDRLSGILEEDESIEAAFETVSRMVASSIVAMWRLITTPGVINLDFADVRRMVMDSHGLCSMVCEEASGRERAAKVIGRIIEHPLFECRKILSEARAVIVGISGGSDLKLIDIQQIMTCVKDLLGEGTRLVMGTAIDPSSNGRISVVLLTSERFILDEPLEDETASDEKEDLLTRKKHKKAKPVQSQLRLVDTPGKGRFKDVEPTLRNGEDIDVPAFIRRGIKLS